MQRGVFAGAASAWRWSCCDWEARPCSMVATMLLQPSCLKHAMQDKGQ